MAVTAGTVLVLRALGLGDALAAVPALRGIRRALPDARLVLAAPAALGDWQRHLGLVDEVLPTTGLGPLGWTGTPPEVAVNLHGRGPQSHRALLATRPGRLVAFAVPDIHPQGPVWCSESHEVDRWCHLVGLLGQRADPTDLLLPRPPGPARGAVVVHPGAGAPARRWPVPRWQRVVRGLRADGHHVVVTGTRAEAIECAQVAATDAQVEDACGELDLDGLSRLVAGAALVISGDTGVAHLATAHRTPSVTLFGPVPPRLWGPRIDHERHRVLWSPHVEDPQGDPHGRHCDPRLARTTPTEVLREARALLAETAQGAEPMRSHTR